MRRRKQALACFGAALSGLALLLSLEHPASACSCNPGATLLVPSTERGLAPGMPLLVAAPDRTMFELRSATGASVGLMPLVSAPALGSCNGAFSLLAPAELLDPRESYVLVSTTSFGLIESKPFAVTRHGPVPAAIPVEITASLEVVEPTALGADSCIDAQLRDRLIGALLHIHVAAPLRAPLVLTARVEDSLSGSLLDATSWVPWQPQGDLHLTLDLPVEASRCADVALVDLSARPVFVERLCPGVDEPVMRSVQLNLLTVPEPPQTTTPGDGCALTNARRTTPWPAFAGLAGVLLGVVGRRRSKWRAN